MAEDRDEYLADNIFWVPPEARWPYLQKNAKRPEIGTLGDDALNLAIRGIDGKIEWGDSFLNDKHKDLKADYILANPPFNMEDWGYSKVKNDVRWRRFDQPSGNAQFSLPPGGERKQKDGSFVHVDGGIRTNLEALGYGE